MKVMSMCDVSMFHVSCVFTKCVSTNMSWIYGHLMYSYDSVKASSFSMSEYHAHVGRSVLLYKVLLSSSKTNQTKSKTPKIVTLLISQKHLKLYFHHEVHRFEKHASFWLGCEKQSIRSAIYTTHF